MAKRGPKGPNVTSFKPGQSGNPNGRPKLTLSDIELRDMCRGYCPEAIETVYRLMKESEEDRVKVSCAEILLERGHGKPQQSVTISGDADNPIVHELIVGPRQETMLEWQERRAKMFNSVTVKVIDNGSEEKGSKKTS